MTKTSKSRGRPRPDVLHVLAGARPEELNPESLAGLPRQSKDLARILSAAPSRRSDGPRESTVWKWRAIAMTVALTAIVASTVIVIDHTGQTNGPAHEKARLNPSTAAVADARFLLLSAANSAQAAPSAGTYWRTDTRSGTVEIAQTAGRLFAITRTSSAQWSVGVSSGAESLLVSGLDAATRPRTEEDAALWRSEGAPATVKSAEPLTGGDALRSITMGTRRPMVTRTNVGDKVYALGARNLSYSELRELPSETGALLHRLEDLRPDRPSSESGRSAWLLRVAADLIMMPVKSGVRAAAYRLMADLPGVEMRTDVEDPLGRKGVSVSFPALSHTFLGDVRQRLVVDPASGELLADQSLLMKPSAKAQEVGLKTGVTVNYSATTRMTWSAEQVAEPQDARR